MFGVNLASLLYRDVSMMAFKQTAELQIRLDRLLADLLKLVLMLLSFSLDFVSNNGLRSSFL